MPRKSTVTKAKGRGGGRGRGRGRGRIRVCNDSEGSPRGPTPPPEDNASPNRQDQPAAPVPDLPPELSIEPEETGDDSETVEDDASAFPGPKTKRSRMCTQLNADEQEEVAHFLENHDFIYNKKRTDHLLADKKNRAWEDLARRLGKEVKALTTYFDSIRTQIGKFRRSKSGQAQKELTDRQQWIWDRFQFLVPHIGQVTCRNIQRFRTVSPASPCPIVNEVDTQVDASKGHTPPTSSTSLNRRRIEEEQDQLELEMISSKERQQKLLQVLQTSSGPCVRYPERLKFGEFLGHSFQSLPVPVYQNLKKQMFQLLTAAEIESSAAEDYRESVSPSSIETLAAFPPPSQRPSTSVPGPRLRQWPPWQQGYRQWQPDPSQWPSRCVGPPASVWQSQSPSWVDQQYPGYSKSPSQQDLARINPSSNEKESPSYTTLEPAANSKQNSCTATNESTFNMSEFITQFASNSEESSTIDVTD